MGPARQHDPVLHHAHIHPVSLISGTARAEGPLSAITRSHRLPEPLTYGPYTSVPCAPCPAPPVHVSSTGEPHTHTRVGFGPHGIVPGPFGIPRIPCAPASCDHCVAGLGLWLTATCPSRAGAHALLRQGP